jgi:iron complex outermembrane receptor protein
MEAHGDGGFFIDDRNYDIEIQHSFVLGKRNRIVWGGNYHTTEVDSSYLYPETDHDDLLGFFLQDELKILDNLSFVAGVKFEENSFTGGDWSPRGCILYTPWPDHYFRFSVSRAYRTPSFAADSMRLVQTLPLLPLPLALTMGNERLDPEKMTAFELGYRTTLFKKIVLNVEFYYNELDKYIDIEMVKHTWPFRARWENVANIIAKGIEVSADYPVTSWWTLKANYTFQEIEHKRANKDLPGVPKHKFNICSSFTFKNGFSLDMKAHFVDETEWNELPGEVKIDDYLRFDMRISQKLFSDMVEISLVGQNLTDKLHPETSDVIGSYESERLIYAQVMLKFY